MKGQWALVFRSLWGSGLLWWGVSVFWTRAVDSNVGESLPFGSGAVDFPPGESWECSFCILYQRVQKWADSLPMSVEEWCVCPHDIVQDKQNSKQKFLAALMAVVLSAPSGLVRKRSIWSILPRARSCSLRSSMNQYWCHVKLKHLLVNQQIK